MILFTRKRFKLQALIDFAGRYIYYDNHENTEYNCICSTEMDNTMKKFLIKIGFIYTSMVCSFIGPSHAYLVHGIRTTWTEERIPFTTPNSDAEFMINVLLQTIIFMHAIWAYFALEVASTIFSNVVAVTPQLSKTDLEFAIQLFKNKSITELKLRYRLKNFMKSTCDTDK